MSPLILDEHGNPIESGLQVVPEDGKLDPVLSLETRPSAFTGFSFWLTLAYKEHHFEEMLSADFPGLAQEMQDLIVADASGRLQAQLRPILIAEDNACRLVTEVEPSKEDA